RWNSVLAEIERGIQLRLAINLWVEQLDSGTTGKKKAAAQRKKKQLFLSLEDWDLLETLVEVLTEFRDITLQLSREDIPTISMLLPFYKAMERHLKTQITKHCTSSRNDSTLRRALCQGAEKLEKHFQIALRSDYILLGAVLHPSIRIAYFEAQDLWPVEIAQRAKGALVQMYTKYASIRDSNSSQAGNNSDTVQSQHTPSAAPPAKTNTFAHAIKAAANANSAQVGEVMTETDKYINGFYPLPHTESDRSLLWWKV
ncbi:ribonuclease H-like domain-containing protein, partial [Daedaleopsis nitida]